LGSIQTASAYVNQQAGFYGTAENRISSAIDLANKFQVQAQTQLSSLQDADIPTVATELTQLTTNLNAAMAAQAKRPVTTLFDYLPIG
jgi:flagellin-like hook-associated protein FlgL